MQTLYRAQKGKGGKEEFVRVDVVRLWHDISGIQVALAPDGSYVTMDGKLVEDPGYFDIMPPKDREMAIAWWGRYQERKEQKVPNPHAEIPVETQEEKEESEAMTETRQLLAGLTTIMESQMQQQAAFLSQIMGVVKARVPASLDGMIALYARRKVGTLNYCRPKQWDKYGFESEPHWWGDEQSHVVEETEDEPAWEYFRYMVPADSVNV